VKPASEVGGRDDRSGDTDGYGMERSSIFIVVVEEGSNEILCVGVVSSRLCRAGVNICWAWYSCWCSASMVVLVCAGDAASGWRSLGG
jgi:hypothetical protein